MTNDNSPLFAFVLATLPPEEDCPTGYTPHALGTLPSDCRGCSDYLERLKRHAAQRHDTTVECSTVTDQICLRCSCGANIVCGFGPTPSELVNREQQHRQEVSS